MANDFFENQFVLDTPGATLIKVSLTQTLGLNFNPWLAIKGIRWVGATTAGHLCVLQRADGKRYWESVCAGPNYVEGDLIEREWQQDFRLLTLGSGRVYIYLADKR